MSKTIDCISNNVFFINMLLVFKQYFKKISGKTEIILSQLLHPILYQCVEKRWAHFFEKREHLTYCMFINFDIGRYASIVVFHRKYIVLRKFVDFEDDFINIFHGISLKRFWIFKIYSNSGPIKPGLREFCPFPAG